MLTQHKAANPLWSQQSLVPGKGQGINMQLLHINRKNTSALGTIHKQKQPFILAKLSHPSKGQQGATYIAGVRHKHSLSPLLHQLGQSLQLQITLLVAGDATKAYLGSRCLLARLQLPSY